MSKYTKHPRADEREAAAEADIKKVWQTHVSVAIRKLLTDLAAEHNCHLSKCSIALDLRIDHVPGMEEEDNEDAPCEEQQA